MQNFDCFIAKIEKKKIKFLRGWKMATYNDILNRLGGIEVEQIYSIGVMQLYGSDNKKHNVLSLQKEERHKQIKNLIKADYKRNYSLFLSVTMNFKTNEKTFIVTMLN